MTEKVGGLDGSLSEGAPAARFVEPIVTKQGSVFLLCSPDGDILPHSDQGLYFHDTRYLCQESLRVDGQPLVLLLTDAPTGDHVTFHLTNPTLHDTDGSVRVRKETLRFRLHKRPGREYVHSISVENYSIETICVTLSLTYDADFFDMFQVRGVKPAHRGRLHAPRWKGAALSFRYDGADGHERRLNLHFDPEPDSCQDRCADYQLVLEPRGSWEATITAAHLDRSGNGTEGTAATAGAIRSRDVRRAREGRMGEGARVTTSNRLFNQVLSRSFLDLHMLRMRQHQESFYAAGVPWYVALFGRDSLITAIQMIAFEPRMADETLHVLAAHQGSKVDDWRDEQPGKILHELRVGEMANLDEIPQTPYFGTVDSTPLFLILLAEYCAWTGTLALFHELGDAVRGALEWIDIYGDTDGDGFVDYKTRSSRGLRNQGWKDSWNGVVLEDGQLAEPPIALAEVQGYVYLAWRGIADLFRRDGDAEAAARLEDRARRLREAFNRTFWLEDSRYYGLCRQHDGRISRSITSNGAQTLWTGIVDPSRVSDVVRRVMQPDMFSGWGIRTLSSADTSYNPIDYQVGSVWPHDTSIVVVGMYQNGYADEANEVFGGMMLAATKVEHFRLPETFAGYDREYSSGPVRYPVACNPQAWASAAVPFMLRGALGLRPEGFERRLRIVRPSLPEWLESVAVRDLRVGGAEVDLRFERSGHATLVSITGRRGELQVSVEY